MAAGGRAPEPRVLVCLGALLAGWVAVGLEAVVIGEVHENVTLHCGNISGPRGLVTWYRNDSEPVFLLSSNSSLLPAEPRFSLVNVSSLHIEALSLQDEGNYTCREILNVTQWFQVWLQVARSPSVLSEPMKTCFVGGNVTLTCQVSGAYPPAKILWLRNLTQPEVITQPSSHHLITQDGQNSTLTIHNCSQDLDEGYYVCRADNPVGVREVDIWLSVKEPLNIGGIVGTIVSLLLLGLATISGLMLYYSPVLCWKVGNTFRGQNMDDVMVLVDSEEEEEEEEEEDAAAEEEEGAQEREEFPKEIPKQNHIHRVTALVNGNIEQMGNGFQDLQEEPLLLAELKPGRPHQFDWKSSCETWSVAFSPDGSWFAWSQGHCIVKLIPWPLEEQFIPKGFEAKSRSSKNETKGRGSPKEKTLDCGQIVWGLAFSPWPSPPSRKLWARHHPQVPDVSCLVLATGLNDGQIKIWEVQTGLLLLNLSGHQDVVRDLSFTPSGSLILVSASRDKTLRIWDLNKHGKQIQVLSGHLQWVYCCSISPDCSMLCSAAGEKSVFLWSMRSYTLIRKLEGHQSSVVSCDFSPDSALLVTASYDTNVIMWDPYTGERLRSLHHTQVDPAMDDSDVHISSLRSVCFSPEGLYLATVADDRLLRIWALELKTPIAFAPMTNGLCCTFFPHGGVIATGTRDGHVQFWTAPRVLSSLKHLCRKALRSFLTTYQVLALPIPKKMKEFLTYRTF
uniref:WD repeat and SOCS box-containing protein 2 n=1 Tax=Callithrix jacchus TaxID=9483 RepID=A0A8I3ZZJ6_CALJA